MSKALDELRDAIYGTSLLQPFSSEGRGGILSVLCRQTPGQEKAVVRLIEHLLQVTDWWESKLHICRRYVIKDSKMVAGICIRIEMKTAAELLDAVRKLVPELAKGPSMVNVEKAPPAPTPIKKYVSPYQDKTAKNVKDAMAEEGSVMGTTAEPRLPEATGPDPTAPTGYKFAMKNLENGVQVMPLPHVHSRDQNIPNKKGRGAYGNGQFTPPGRG